MTGLLDLTKEAPCLMEPRIGATRFFSQDVRKGKRSIFASESPENQRLFLATMEREWKKWEGVQSNIAIDAE